MITLEKVLWGGAIGGLAITIPLAGQLPTWAKTTGLATSFFSSVGLVVLESLGKDWKKYQLAQQRINESAIELRYSAVDAINQAAAELQYRFALKQWIVNYAPVETWENSFAEYGLTAIALPEIQAAREALGLLPPPMLELEAEVVPKPQTTQGSVIDAALQQLEEDLDTEWFGQWGRRSGIVCGESGDGKSWLLTNIVLAQFIKDNTDPQTGQLNAKIYICDPDYGSSHGDSEPNTWLDLPVDRVVYFKILDIYKTVMHVNREVDRRAEETAERRAQKLDKLNYEPILLIVDEEPMVAAALDAMEGDKLADFVLAIANILRRGLKQNVTFKMGTQTLAVGAKGKGGTRLNMDLLRQVEMVILWRAAQVKENYDNLGIRPAVIEDVLKQVLPLPQKMGSKFVCVTYLKKQLQIAAIPEVKAVQVQDGAQLNQQPIDGSKPTGDIYQFLLQWQQENPDASDDRLLAKFKELTGRQLNAEGLQSLKDLLDRMRGAA